MDKKKNEELGYRKNVTNNNDINNTKTASRESEKYGAAQIEGEECTGKARQREPASFPTPGCTDTAEEKGISLDAEKRESSERVESLEALVASLEEQVNLKDAQIEELMNRLKQLQADFDNYRRRTKKEKEEMVDHATTELIKKLLPVLDNFERAMRVDSDDATSNSFLEGIEMIFKQLKEVLLKEGLKPIEVVGEQFDPSKHEAVMRVKSEEHEENVIIEEVRKGYTIKDKVIRPAMVKVACKSDG